MTKAEAIGDRDREVLIALEGRLARKSIREIAEDPYGAERVAADWGSNSGLRARTRQLLRKARGHAESGRFHGAPGR